ncbi:MAG: 2-C-methyl-D-erythritol 2,4-cyclodiphosphate synthase [Clostridia bacterium]|jgi:2-C-methyl-D-erythritol 4-phosphate cytidylyltransferase / 2-C-methyl-D-erythritol 2,4-cyclodiphosphate synthase|nr:2-C-methyl-D-erythritol 2,4-cyclodiphosphate synthase [Clostridia bacterium]NLS84202.1 2-C-methyl-D-erythritol 2,4-cyclodiphosphate synthase [Oscillospiraceae bacterium]
MLNDKTVAAIIVAGGSSSRMGFDKLFFEIDGETVLLKSMKAFDECENVDEIIVVAGKNYDDVKQLAPLMHKPCTVVTGGATRAQSVKNGFEASQSEIICIHDAARPFVSQKIITDALSAAVQYGASAPAVPVKDTIKIVQQNSMVKSTPDRASLFAVQTPQCFLSSLYQKALAQIDNDLVTDDCSLFELAGMPVKLTQGEYANYKITTREDLPAPKGDNNMNIRIGHGYDVHRLVENRKLILGGVEIEYEKGLLGHSDADVLAHAVADALLGAAAMGDIGKHFPDTAAEYAGADSLVLLSKVVQKLAENGFSPVNIDATLLCQRPKLAPYITQMRENLAKAAGIDVADVSVKATTEEGLGFTGNGEGIAAHAVCLIQKGK